MKNIHEWVNTGLIAIVAILLMVGGNSQPSFGSPDGYFRMPNSNATFKTITSSGGISGTTGLFSSTLGVTGEAAFSATTTVGSFLDVSEDLLRLGVGTTTPLDIFHVENQSASTSIVLSTKAASKGASIILEDLDGAGCSEISVLNGVLTTAVATCPTGI